MKRRPFLLLLKRGRREGDGIGLEPGRGGCNTNESKSLLLGKTEGFFEKKGRPQGSPTKEVSPLKVRSTPKVFFLFERETGDGVQHCEEFRGYIKGGGGSQLGGGGWGKLDGKPKEVKK